MATDLKPPIIFFGSDDFSVAALTALQAADWPIAAVVTKPDSRSGRKLALTSPLVKTLASQQGVPVIQPEKLGEVVEELSQFGVQLGVVASYGKIIPDSVLALFPGGLVNIHPSLLPKYRGPSPIETVILNGDIETSVSIMKLVSEMDAGPVYVQEKVALSGQETAPILRRHLASLGAELLVKVLPDIISGNLEPVPQDDGAASFSLMINKSDGQLDWGRPAAEIDRHIRAYLGWPGSRTQLFGKDVIITAAHVETDQEQCRPGKDLNMATGEGCLVIDRLKPAGGREMSASEFLAGIRR